MQSSDRDNEQLLLLQPIEFTTSRLHIRRFLDSDCTSVYLGWLNDEEHMRFSNQRFVEHTIGSAETYRDEFDSQSRQFLAIEYREQLSGTLTVHAEVQHGTADIGVLVGRSFVGTGIGREAVRGLTHELFRQGARKVTIGTSALNRPMQVIAEHLGFRLEGRRVRQEVIGGKEVDVFYYGLFAEDFQ